MRLWRATRHLGAACCLQGESVRCMFWRSWHGNFSAVAAVGKGGCSVQSQSRVWEGKGFFGVFMRLFVGLIESKCFHARLDQA